MIIALQSRIRAGIGFHTCPLASFKACLSTTENRAPFVLAISPLFAQKNTSTPLLHPNGACCRLRLLKVQHVAD